MELQYIEQSKYASLEQACPLVRTAPEVVFTRTMLVALEDIMDRREHLLVGRALTPAGILNRDIFAYGRLRAL